MTIAVAVLPALLATAPEAIAHARTYVGPSAVESTQRVEPKDSATPTSPGPETTPVQTVSSPDPAAPSRPEKPPARDTLSGRALAGLEEGFAVTSADERFGLSIGFLGQMRYQVQESEGEIEHGFVLRLVRPFLDAYLWDDKVHVFIQPEFAPPEPRLLDAQVTLNLHEAIGFHVGQYRSFYSRGFMTGLPVQLLPDRGPVVDEFRVDRDLGVTAFGRPFDGRLEYYVGVLNGEGPNAVGNVDPNMLYTGRVVVAPLGPVGYTQTPGLGDAELPFRIAFGANGYTNVIEESEVVTDPMTGQDITVALPDRREIGASADVALHWDRLSSQGEYFWRRRLREGGPDTTAWGAYGQVGVMAVRNRLQLGFRTGVLDLEDRPDIVVPIEPGFNIFIAGNHAKIQFRYRCDVDLGESGCASQVGMIQAQLQI